MRTKRLGDQGARSRGSQGRASAGRGYSAGWSWLSALLPGPPSLPHDCPGFTANRELAEGAFGLYRNHRMSLHVLCSVYTVPVASQGCHSRAPHSAWLEITESLAHRSQGQVFKSRWHQGWFLLEGPGGGRGCSLPLCQLLVAAGNRGTLGF